MRDDIIAYLEQEIKTRCESPHNFFGMGCYYHIKAVVKNAELLCDQYGADKEVVIIASWLHDIASISNYEWYGEHHIYGAKMAGDILEGFNYPLEYSRPLKDNGPTWEAAV